MTVRGHGRVADLYGLFTPVDVPQSRHDLRHHDVTGVLADQPQREDSVVPEVLHDEAGGQLLVRARAQAVHDLQELPDVVDAGGGEHHVPQPGGEGGASQERDEDQPEPHEDVDLLVEEVDGQHALHAVAVVVGHLADLEVAHGHPGEAARGRPLRARHQVLQHLEPVQVVVRRQEGVQHEELADGVGDVQHLHHDVHRQQVVPVAPPAQDGQLGGQDVA